MLRKRIVALSMLVTFLPAAAAGGPQPSQPARRPVPGERSQADALRRLKTILKSEYARTGTEDVAKLGRLLLEHAGQTGGEPASQYVMYLEAQKAALRAGDVETALAAADALASKFQVDALTDRTELLMDASRTARATDARKLLVAECMKHIDSLIAADGYAAATQLAARAEYLALRIRHAPTTQRLREQKKRLLHTKAEFAKVAGAARALKVDPDDPKANLAMGRFACFVKGDWAAGLPRLAKGGDGALRELAGMSLSGPTKPANCNELANAWWALAAKMPPPARNHVWAHAAKWYRLALPGLKGLAKLAAAKRIAEAEKAGKGPSRVIDLLAKIDLNQDARPRDKWAVYKGTLRCVKGHMVPKVVLPYEPPEEYDVRFSFMQPKLRHSVGLILPKAGTSFAWLVGEDAGSTCVFTINGDHNGPANPTRKTARGLIQPNRKYTSTVKVRNDSVKAYINGRLVVDYKTDFKDMRTTVWHRISETRQLGIFADDPTVFYELTVTEVTGKGKTLR